MMEDLIRVNSRARRSLSIALAVAMFTSVYALDPVPVYADAADELAGGTEADMADRVSELKSQVAGLIQDGTSKEKYVLYPAPHEIQYSDTMVNLTDEVAVYFEEGIDDYTRECLTDDLSDHGFSAVITSSTEHGGTTILLGIYGSGGAVDQMASGKADSVLFSKSDAYLLYTTSNKIVILGKDADSAYYGVNTLRQMFEQKNTKLGYHIFGVTIKDYSDIKFRGFIEGYYGNPWTVEDRIELMKFGGRFKMNRYIFAPKDDIYHNKKWRELYPDEELSNISRMAQAGNESKCQFTWSIHPFMNAAFDFSTEETYQRDFGVITDKFSQLLEADVRSFGILADDAASASAGHMRRLTNELRAWLVEQKAVYPDIVTNLVFCPADYYGNGGSDFLRTMNAGLSDEIYIMQTGGRIWGEVTPSFGRNFKRNIASDGTEGRYPFMWINWPCTDNSKQHLIMGGYKTFLHPGIDPSTYEGIVLNPMQQSEPSKVAIFGNAQYAWNVWETEEQADRAWNDSFKYVDHLTYEDNAASASLRELSKHMINQNMDGRVTVLQESAELAPKLNLYKEALKTGASLAEAGGELEAEFMKLQAAAKVYREQAGNTRARDQIVNWLNCWDDTTQAVLNLLKGETAYEAGEYDKVWEYYSAAQKAFEQSKSYKFWYVDHYENAEVGVQHIVPFINTAMSDLAVKVSLILDPTKVIGRFITNRTDNPSGDTANVTDGNLATETVFRTPNSIAKGTYVGLMYNRPIELDTVTFEVGCNSNLGDTFSGGKMQYTVDGTEWIDIEGTEYEDERSTVTSEGLGLTAKGIRLIATMDKSNTWMGVREIAVNPVQQEEDEGEAYAGTLIRSGTWSVYSGSESNLTDGNDNSFVWYKTSPGDTTRVGDYIGFDLGEVYPLGKVRFVIGAGDGDKWSAYHLEYSSDGSSWTTYGNYTGSAAGSDVIEENLRGKTARYVRMVNDKTIQKWVKFSGITVRVPVATTDYTYTNADAYKKIGNELDEEHDTVALSQTSDITLKPGVYLGIKLKTIKKISGVTLQADGAEDLTLQVSANGQEWRNIDFTDESDIPKSKYFRLINRTDEDITFDLITLRVMMDVRKGIRFVETSMGIHPYYGDNDSRKTGTLGAMFDSDFSTITQFCDYPRENGYIIYDLGVDREIKSIRAYTLDGEKNYLRDGIIQVSNDRETWVDVAEIGNRVSNTEFGDDQAGDGWTHDPKNPGNYYFEGALEKPLTSRYLRIYFTADYNHRFITFNEIIINEGEYVPDSVDDRFDATVLEEKGYGPENMLDGDLSSCYRPSKSGSIIYYLEDPSVEQITVVQGGSLGAVLSARVSNILKPRSLLREEDTTWIELGVLDRSLVTFYNRDYQFLYDLKLTWDDDTIPSIYQLLVLGDVSLRPDDSEILQTMEDAGRQFAGMKEEDYTVASYQAFVKAMENLLKVYQDVRSGNVEYKRAIDVYTKAYESLEKVFYYTTNIKITKRPVKTNYAVGEAFNPEGMKVTEYMTASPSNASRENILSDDAYEYEYDFSKSGKQRVTVSYLAYNAIGEEVEFNAWMEVDVTAEEYYTKGLNVIKIPVKTEYEVGETFDPEGMTLVHVQKASPGNADRYDPVSPDECEFKYNFSTPGNKKVTVIFIGEDLKGNDKIVKAYVPVKVKPDHTGSSEDSRPVNTYPSDMTPGTWAGSDEGWRFLLQDGTYAASRWVYTYWNGKAYWYYFNDLSILASGWYTDADGKTYYLHDADDGVRGYMYTGWNHINGRWYYFNPLPFGTLGAMYVNQVTPDGYLVGEDGSWTPVRSD